MIAHFFLLALCTAPIVHGGGAGESAVASEPEKPSSPFGGTASFRKAAPKPTAGETETPAKPSSPFGERKWSNSPRPSSPVETPAAAASNPSSPFGERKWKSQSPPQRPLPAATPAASNPSDSPFGDRKKFNIPQRPEPAAKPIFSQHEFPALQKATFRKAQQRPALQKQEPQIEKVELKKVTPKQQPATVEKNFNLPYTVELAKTGVDTKMSYAEIVRLRNNKLEGNRRQNTAPSRAGEEVEGKRVRPLAATITDEIIKESGKCVWKFTGCKMFNDTERVTGQKPVQVFDDESSPATCIQKCNGIGKVAAVGSNVLKNGAPVKCFCYEKSLASITSKSVCITTCSGDTEDTCGGIGAINTYECLDEWDPLPVCDNWITNKRCAGATKEINGQNVSLIADGAEIVATNMQMCRDECHIAGYRHAAWQPTTQLQALGSEQAPCYCGSYLNFKPQVNENPVECDNGLTGVFSILTCSDRGGNSMAYNGKLGFYRS